jgi:hypothetical protein
MDRMREAKKEKATNDTGNAAKQENPKPKKQKRKSQSSHTDLKDDPSAITLQDKALEIVNEPLDRKDSTRNVPNRPTPQLPPAQVDSGEEPPAEANLRRRDELEWFGNWEDDL